MDIKKILHNDKFALLLGIELLEAADGKAKTRLQIKDEHLNAMHIVHGGVIFTLADFTLAAAANSHWDTAVAINASISFLKAGKKEILYAEAVEISRNNKLATYLVNINNAEKELIASYQGMAYRKKEAVQDI